MKNPRVARRYAHALIEVAGEQRSVDTVADDLTMIGRTLTGSRELRLLLASPVVPDRKKSEILKALFGSRIHAVTSGFIDLLVRRHREDVLQDMIDQYLALRDELRGIMTIDVTSVAPLEQKQEKALAGELGKRTGKTVRLRVTEDASIKGGLVVKIGDTVLDASVRRQLERLRERFKGTVKVSTV